MLLSGPTATLEGRKAFRRHFVVLVGRAKPAQPPPRPCPLRLPLILALRPAPRCGNSHLKAAVGSYLLLAG